MTLPEDPAAEPRSFDTAALELPRVLERLAAHTSFSGGRDLALALLPAAEPGEVQSRLRATSEARQLLTLNPGLGLGGARDVRPYAERAGRGAVLQPTELLEICGTIRAGRLWATTLDRLRDRLPALSALADRIHPHSDLFDAIDQAIDEAGEVTDRASPRLREIRSQRRSSQDRLLNRLQSLLASSGIRDALQDAIVRQRNGRYVLPVRAEMRGQVKGIVHDQSASGATVFMEPLELVELGNRARELEIEEQHEVERVLRDLSQRVADGQMELAGTVGALAELDLARSKAWLAEEMRAVEPGIAPFGTGRRGAPELVLIDARHPLLGAQAVPITVELGGDFDILVITGPNTGGKTVALKTVGLLALMGQAGLHIPAAEGSRIPIFQRIFADIGDEQSIEQSLSTFSGHVTNIVRMLDDLEPTSLVLLDELGAGTDPLEGAALARALLDRLLAEKVLAIATTHYSELKVYAQQTPRVRNASVEFDVETLRPTYRLRIGLPGQSNALTIAERLGAPADVLRSAQAWLGPSALRVEELLREIQEEHRRTEAAQQEAARQRQIAEAARRQAEEALAEAERQRAEAYELAEQRAERELEAVRREAQRLLAEARRARPEPREAEEAVAALQRLKPPRAPRPVPRAPAQTGRVKPGSGVRVKSIGALGTVLSLAPTGEVEVEVGGMRLRTRDTDLEPVSRSERVRPASVLVSARSREPGAPSVPIELHLRGLRVEEALEQLDRYLHDAAMAGLPRVRIIHGKGTGAVRRAVWAALAGHPLVRSYQQAADAEGGAGATVMELVAL